MFGIGGTELVVLLIIIALLLGPEQIPGLVKGAQKIVREITKARSDFKASVDQDETLRSVKESLTEVKQGVQTHLDDVTKGVRGDIEKIKAQIEKKDDQ